MTSTSLLLHEDAATDMTEHSETADCGPYISDAGTYEISKPLNTAMGSWITSATSCMQIQEWQNVFLCLFFWFIFASTKCFEKYRKRIKRRIFEC